MIMKEHVYCVICVNACLSATKNRMTSNSCSVFIHPYFNFRVSKAVIWVDMLSTD